MRNSFIFKSVDLNCINSSNFISHTHTRKKKTQWKSDQPSDQCTDSVARLTAYFMRSTFHSYTPLYKWCHPKFDRIKGLTNNNKKTISSNGYRLQMQTAFLWMKIETEPNKVQIMMADWNKFVWFCIRGDQHHTTNVCQMHVIGRISFISTNKQNDIISVAVAA